jgi:hypothetical protein
MKSRPGLISDIAIFLFWNIPPNLQKNTNFSNVRLITKVSIKQIFEIYIQG